jgi:hypothetical protein
MIQTSAFYQRENKGALLRKGDEQLHVFNSPITGEPIKWKTIDLPSEDVERLTFKTTCNGRGSTLLKPSAVLDILPSIRKNKRNLFRIYALKHDDGRYEILAGTRRAYCVSITPGAMLGIYYVEQLSDEDKIAISNIADKQDKPSPLDVGLSIVDWAKDLKEGEFSLRNASKVFGVSKTVIPDYMAFAGLPVELFNLYPGLRYLKPEFMRKILKLKLSNEEIISRIKHLEPIEIDIESVTEDFQIDFNPLVKKLDSEVLKALQPGTEDKNDCKDTESQTYKPGVLVSESKSMLKISLPKSLDENIIKQVLALISQN